MRARIAAWLRMPFLRHLSSNFSFGLWMRSSESPKPTRMESRPSFSCMMAHDRNGAAATHHRGGLAIDIGEPGARGLHERPAAGHNNAGRGAHLLDAPPAIGRRPLVQKLSQPLQNLGRVLVGNGAEAQLGGSAACDHRFRAGTGVAAPDAVQVAGWPRPQAFQHTCSLPRPRIASGRSRPRTRPRRRKAPPRLGAPPAKVRQRRRRSREAARGHRGHEAAPGFRLAR